jgi:hypothetical protein
LSGLQQQESDKQDHHHLIEHQETVLLSAVFTDFIFEQEYACYFKNELNWVRQQHRNDRINWGETSAAILIERYFAGKGR